jgi:hypothetical protein
MNPEVARYGESHALWSGDEARAFAAVSACPRGSPPPPARRRRGDLQAAARPHRLLDPQRRLGADVLVGPEIVAREGYVLAVRVLGEKPLYNQVEDLTGRLVRLRGGDVIAGRARLAARPARLRRRGAGRRRAGDVVQILNLGGVLGRCTAGNPDLGPPFDAEVLGAVLSFPRTGDRVGRPATIRDGAVPQAQQLEPGAPVVAVVGTCMDAGKTVAASEIVRGLSRAGLRCAGVKLTGVSLRRDALSMIDAGRSRP